MLRRAVTKFTGETIVKPTLTRQLGMHKWNMAENCVRDRYASQPGTYIVSSAADCVFCINVNEQRELQHVILPQLPRRNVIDLTQ